MAILILAFDCAPVHKKIFKAVDYDSKPPFGLGLDHQWLGFFQHETGSVFAQYNAGKPDPFHTYGQGHRLNLFDPKGEWLINHQNARPYGTETVPPSEEGTAAEGEGGQQGGGRAAAAECRPGRERSAARDSGRGIGPLAHGRAARPAGLV